MKTFRFILSALAFYTVSHTALAQDPHLHVNTKWEECSFQLDPSLTQKSWREFTNEAGMVVYFRPLTDAKPMGARNFEFSILQWETGIDDSKDAWNDTFVHHDSTHWLVKGPRLGFPGLTFRAGLTDRIDAGVYLTKAPGANYGFWGAQIQYNLINDVDTKWAASARASFVSLYGPKDLSFSVSGLDLLASKEFSIYSKWASIAPYAGISTRVGNSHEKSEVTNVSDEHVLGGHAMVGAVAKIFIARLGVEYSFAKVNTFSFKLGIAF